MDSRLEQLLAAKIDQLGERLDRRIEQLSERLDRTDQRIEQLDRHFDQLNQRVGDLEGVTTKGYVRAAKVCYLSQPPSNRALFSDALQLENLLYQDDNHLVEVPFPDGTFPWGKEVPGPSKTVRTLYPIYHPPSASTYDTGMLQRVVLPELKSIGAVKTLSTPQLYGFCRGYYPSEQLPRDGSRCREMILAAIGRRRDAHLL